MTQSVTKSSIIIILSLVFYKSISYSTPTSPTIKTYPILTIGNSSGDCIGGTNAIACIQNLKKDATSDAIGQAEYRCTNEGGKPDKLSYKCSGNCSPSNISENQSSFVNCSQKCSIDCSIEKPASASPANAAKETKNKNSPKKKRINDINFFTELGFVNITDSYTKSKYDIKVTSTSPAYSGQLSPEVESRGGVNLNEGILKLGIISDYSPDNDGYIVNFSYLKSTTQTKFGMIGLEASWFHSYDQLLFHLGLNVYHVNEVDQTTILLTFSPDICGQIGFSYFINNQWAIRASYTCYAYKYKYGPSTTVSNGLTTEESVTANSRVSGINTGVLYVF